jgi:hypothetical protein
VIGQLAERYPDTFGLIPKGLFMYGSGGVAGWANICGAPNAGAALLTQLGAPTNVKDNFLAWYEKNLFPSNAAYLDYRSGTWVPGGTTGGVWGGSGLPIPLNNAPKARPESLLCHSSHGLWTAASTSWIAVYGAAAGSDRCSKVVYDTVYYFTTLINTWKAGGSIDGSIDPTATSAGCMSSSCHGSTGPVPARGKMTCTPCHTQRLGDNHGL